ncbi:MAG: hypothetical protein M1837_001981 [Sclerophora amabilis]|nr:MAG: hypothetical protein M1837_001981 [Sclerophora amabilis]
MNLLASRTVRCLDYSYLNTFPKSQYRCFARRTPIQQNRAHRSIHSSSTLSRASPVPKSKDRGPKSQEDTQTDFSELNVLSNTAAPATSIDACHSDGFQLDSGLKIVGGNGVLLLSGEAFTWRPWLGRNSRLLNAKGQWECGSEAWGLLDLVWPKPDLLILGLGPSMHPISPETRAHINSLGIRVEVQDTRNAAAQFNLLATERGVGNIAAALIPMGWKETR